jgi:hypothetical protein
MFFCFKWDLVLNKAFYAYLNTFGIDTIKPLLLSDMAKTKSNKSLNSI